MQRAVWAIAVAITSVSSGAAAQARDPASFDGIGEVLPSDDAPAQDQHTNTAGEHWYGDQILVLAGVSAGFMLAGTVGYVTASSDRGRDGAAQVTLFGIAGLGAGVPLVHLGHGYAGRALGSLAMESGLGLGGGFAGAFVGAELADHACATSDKDIPPCMAYGELLGVGAGVLGSAAIDAFVRAYDLPVTPAVGYDGRRFSLGVAGHF